jgi:hypothetical protein
VSGFGARGVGRRLQRFPRTAGPSPGTTFVPRRQREESAGARSQRVAGAERCEIATNGGGGTACRFERHPREESMGAGWGADLAPPPRRCAPRAHRRGLEQQRAPLLRAARVSRAGREAFRIVSPRPARIARRARICAAALEGWTMVPDSIDSFSVI